MMQIWVDADACPVVIKEILFRVAERLNLNVTLVANQLLRIPASRFIRALQVPSPTPKSYACSPRATLSSPEISRLPPMCWPREALRSVRVANSTRRIILRNSSQCGNLWMNCAVAASIPAVRRPSVMLTANILPTSWTAICTDTSRVLNVCPE